MKNALLILSHGSRRTASNDEVFALTAQVRKAAGTSMTLVDCAFLEITRPTVQEKIDELAAAGITDIQVFPHFLAAGTHVTTDIPREIDIAREKHPHIHFHLLPHLGSLGELSGLILRSIASETEHCRPESG